MSFLFAALPAKNCEMTATELSIWQRSAIFECECDNLINQHIEADDRQNGLRINRWNRRRRINAAIDAAISTHGLRLGPNEYTPRTRSASLPQHQLGERDSDWNVLVNVLDSAYSAATRDLGLNLPNLDP